MVKLINTETGHTFLEKVLVRTSFWGRLTGYLLKSRIKNCDGILLINTSRVHTCGMSLSLDLYFLDSGLRLIAVDRCIKPNRIPPSPADCKHILEVPHNASITVPDVKAGDRFGLSVRIER